MIQIFQPLYNLILYYTILYCVIATWYEDYDPYHIDTDINSAGMLIDIWGYNIGNS